MFDFDDFEWIESATPAEAPAADVLFLVAEDFYVGDPNSHEQLFDPAYQVPLNPPFEGGAVSVSQLIGNVSPLAEHYRRIVELAQKQGRAVEELRHYFWMRLVIRWSEEAFSLPWHDTWSEMIGLLEWLRAADEDQSWHDIEQGWQMMVVRRGPYFYFRAGDGDDEEYFAVRVERQALLDSIEPLIGTVERTIDELSARLGTDVWTRWGYRQVVRFGTSDWDPARAAS